MAYPTNYRYTREHEWIRVDGDIGTIGITDYAQNSLGDIVYVDVPKVGDSVTANCNLWIGREREGGQRPLLAGDRHRDGVNEELKTAPDKINEAAHETWIIKVELSDPAELNTLLDAAAYEAFVSEETRQLSIVRKLQFPVEALLSRSLATYHLLTTSLNSSNLEGSSNALSTQIARRTQARCSPRSARASIDDLFASHSGRVSAHARPRRAAPAGRERDHRLLQRRGRARTPPTTPAFWVRAPIATTGRSSSIRWCSAANF